MLASTLLAASTTHDVRLPGWLTMLLAGKLAPVFVDLRTWTHLPIHIYAPFIFGCSQLQLV